MKTSIILTRYTRTEPKTPPLFLLWVENIININENFSSNGKFVNTFVYYDIGQNRNQIFTVAETVLEINQKMNGDILTMMDGVIA